MFSKFVSFISIITIFQILPSSSFATNLKVGGVRFNKEITPWRVTKRENIVTQSLDYSCGPAGLSTLINYYLNDKISEQEIIATLLKTVPIEKVKSNHGFTLLDLKKYAISKGYKVSGLKMSEESLRNLSSPILVRIKFKNYYHFVIVKGVVGDRVFIADPSIGNVSLKINKFMDFWTNGVALLIQRSDNKKPLKFALNVTKKDFIIADYKSMNRLIDTVAFRTRIFPGEF